MVSRRFVLVTSILATAVSCFTLGVLHTHRADAAATASYDAKLEAIRNEMRAFGKPSGDGVKTAGTSGQAVRSREESSPAARARMVAEIKDAIQSEMGLVPLHLVRDRRASFVELYSTDNAGKTNYGTACYLGRGYFVTVKHAVVALNDEDDRPTARKITSVRIVYKNKEIPARVVDTGDADVEVHSGDWAIIRTRDLDLPALRVDSAFAYDFADPIFRLGNDYSKGIILATGYVGQRTANGLVTCLTDGHPGVSGGGVLNQRGDLVGIPIGRMQGDYRFSFILPIRAEMLRKVPSYDPAPPAQTVVAEPQH